MRANPQNRRLRHKLQYGLFLALAKPLSLVPLRARVSLCCGVARIAGKLGLDAAVRENLRTAFGADLPNEKRREIRLANTRALGRFVAELLDYMRDGPGTAKRLVFHDETFETLKRAHALGKGVIIVTPHFGNWELMPAYVATFGYVGGVVARAPANPYFADMLLSMRTRAAVPTFDALTGQRQILDALAKGGMLGLLPDLDSKRASGDFVQFFGRPTFTSTGAARLAVSSGAPIVPAYIIPEGNKYRLTFEEPILPNGGAERKAEVLRLTQAWSERFERKIRERPELWVWIHNRWETTPEKAEERRKRRAASRGLGA